MKRTISLNQNHLFKRAYFRGKSFVSDCLVMYYIKNDCRPINRLGITTGKKVGKAVVRNRIRRLIKENYIVIEPTLKEGIDIVIVARRNAVQKNFHAIGSALRYMMRKAGLIERND